MIQPIRAALEMMYEQKSASTHQLISTLHWRVPFVRHLPKPIDSDQVFDSRGGGKHCLCIPGSTVREGDHC